MAEWTVVASGKSLADAASHIPDFKMPKGTRMLIEMETGTPWMFDGFWAEWAFKSSVPPGMKLIDVWGEGDKGYAELEVNGTGFIAVLGFLRTWGVIIVLGGLLLWTIVSFVTIMVKLPAVATVPIWLLLGAAAGALGIIYLGTKGKTVSVSRGPPK